jgi:hypothetical protein
MSRSPVSNLMLMLGLSLPLVACGGSPDKLAESLQRAFQAGDQEAALALARLDGAPAQLHFFFLDQVGDCAEAGTTCTTTLAPLDDKFKEQAEGLAEQGLEIIAPPEGIVVVEAKSETGSGKMRMPYAKVDGDYRIVSQRYSAAKLDEMRGKSNAALLQEMLDNGIYDPASGERRTDWKDTATELPPGGGDVGAAYRKQVEALAAAVAANDPDAAANNGGAFAAMVVGANDYAGKPVPMEVRKRKLRSQSARWLREIEIEGGWQKGDEAILVFTGKNGIGWIERGALFVTRENADASWGKAGDTTVEYPAN